MGTAVSTGIPQYYEFAYKGYTVEPVRKDIMKQINLENL
jgi:hypothetical protein